MTLRDRKKDKTRTTLLAVALDLFAKQGFTDTTIAQIAAAAEVSPRTVLRYFPSKEDVVVSWVEDGMAVFLDCMRSRPASETPQRSLTASARALVEHYQAHGEFYLAIERVIAVSSAIRARKLEMSAALAEQVTEMLQRRDGVGRWEALLFPPVMFSVIRAAIGEWVAMNGERPLPQFFEDAVRHIKFL